MADEATDQVTQNVSEDTGVSESSAEETQTTSTPQADEAAQTQDEGSAQAPESSETADANSEGKARSGNRTAEARIRELSAKLKEASETRPQPVQQPQFDPNDIPETIDPQEYLQLKQQADIAATLQNDRVAALEQRIEMQNMATNLERDMEVVVKQYPVLDESSEQYDPKIEEAVAELYADRFYTTDPLTGQQYINTNAPRFSEFVSKQMKIYEAAAEKGKGEVTPSLVKQAQSEALTSDSSTKRGSKSFKDLSLAEMEQALGFAEE